MTPLNIGIIGLGRRKYLVKHVHRPQDGVRIIAAADPREDNWAAFAESVNPQLSLTHDYRELLARDDLHAVFILSPDYLHEEHAVAALTAGKHVYLEKPMAITIAGCDRIIETSLRTGSKIYVGHNMRHMDVVLQMKKLIDDGAIGEVRTGWCRHFCAYGGDAYFKDWHAERAKATSLLLQKACHDIDVLHWLCGGHTTRTTGMGNLTVYNQITDRHGPDDYGDASWSFDNWPPLSLKGLNPIIDVEDLSMMLMELDNGVLCSYQQCHYAPDGWRNYTIIGTAGRIENFGDAPGEAVVHLWHKRGAYMPTGHETYPIAAVGGGHGGADPRITAEFINFIGSNGKISTSPCDARASVAAGCAAAESLRNGSRPVAIPPLPAATVAHFARDLKG